MTHASEIVEHLIIPKDRVPAAAYQAIYHKLTSKVEKLSEVFPDAYQIDVEDIVQLDSRLYQMTRQYPVQSQNSTCSLSLKDDERMDSSSIEKFRVLNFTSAKPSQIVNYQFDFFTILPVEIPEAEDIVQRFKVVVLMDQDFMEEVEDGVPYFIRGMSSGSNIRLQIEYSDYAVGRSLQVTVQDWVRNLKTRKVSAIFPFMEHRADFMTSFVPVSFATASLAGMSRLSFSSNPSLATQSLLSALSVSVAMYAIGRMLNVQLYKQLQTAKPLTFLHITSGDRDRCSKLTKKQKRRSWLAAFFGVTIFVGLGVNISSSILLDWWRS